MKHYSAGMNLEDITLSEIRWSQEEKSSQIHRHRKTVGWEEGRGSFYLTGGEFQFGKMKSSGVGWWRRLHNSMNIFNAAGLYS